MKGQKKEKEEGRHCGGFGAPDTIACIDLYARESRGDRGVVPARMPCIWVVHPFSRVCIRLLPMLLFDLTTTRSERE